MYWNIRTIFVEVFAGIDKLQHEMYWNLLTGKPELISMLINYNMRCIETLLKGIGGDYDGG